MDKEITTDGYIKYDEDSDGWNLQKMIKRIAELETKVRIKSNAQILELQYRYADLERENKELRKSQLELHMENAELKDMVLDNGGEYAETDGYEVGSPSDYEEDKQLKLFND